jgi:hypothetical protein
VREHALRALGDRAAPVRKVPPVQEGKVLWEGVLEPRMGRGASVLVQRAEEEGGEAQAVGHAHAAAREGAQEAHAHGQEHGASTVRAGGVRGGGPAAPPRRASWSPHPQGRPAATATLFIPGTGAEQGAPYTRSRVNALPPLRAQERAAHPFPHVNLQPSVTVSELYHQMTAAVGAGAGPGAGSGTASAGAGAGAGAGAAGSGARRRGGTMSGPSALTADVSSGDVVG